MDFSFDSVLTIAGLLLGGGGIGGFFTWRYSRRKERAEAEQAETTAAKEMQDMYQQLVADVKSDREEQKAYIAELKEDRNHLRADRDELRRRQEELEEKIINLNRSVARNGRMVESMRPYMCADMTCKSRQFVTISESGDVRAKKTKKTIEPIDNDEL